MTTKPTRVSYHKEATKKNNKVFTDLTEIKKKKEMSEKSEKSA